MPSRPDHRPLPFVTSEDVPRPRSAPPRLAHLLSGVMEEPPRYTAGERARLISQHRYPPYAPMYRLLARSGHTLKSLARDAGFRPETVSMILRGINEPYFFTGMRLARSLKITPEELDKYLERVAHNRLT
jgi:hypothetical protein